MPSTQPTNPLNPIDDIKNALAEYHRLDKRPESEIKKPSVVEPTPTKVVTTPTTTTTTTTTPPKKATSMISKMKNNKLKIGAGLLGATGLAFGASRLTSKDNPSS